MCKIWNRSEIRLGVTATTQTIIYASRTMCCYFDRHESANLAHKRLYSEIVVFTRAGLFYLCVEVGTGLSYVEWDVF